jgi:hypothetical protein
VLTDPLASNGEQPQSKGQNAASCCVVVSDHDLAAGATSRADFVRFLDQYRVELIERSRS